jgi:hypothetical protein
MSEGKHEDDTDFSAQAKSGDSDTETGAKAKCTICHVGAAVERELDGLWYPAKASHTILDQSVRALVILTAIASCASQIVAVHEDGPTWRETVYDIMYIDDGKTGMHMA